jgi:hypothetical protein
MVHYYDHIKNFGSPNGLCSSITESKHIAAVKRPWRRSNKHAPLQQMLRTNERLDKIAAARVDFTARGMLADSCLVQVIRDILGSSEDSMDEDSSDSETDSDSYEEDGLDGENPPSNSNNTDHDTDGSRDSDNNDNDNDHSDDHHDNDDDDHGPVESGPLMNEVRFVGRKGKDPSPPSIHKLRYNPQRPGKIILHRSVPSVSRSVNTISSISLAGSSTINSTLHPPLNPTT